MATTEQISFSIIAAAGDAQSIMFQSLGEARKGSFPRADKLMKEAEALLTKAHQEQTALIKSEADGQTPEFSILLVHAQDHLMNCVLAKQLIKEMIMLYKEIKD